MHILDIFDLEEKKNQNKQNEFQRRYMYAMQNDSRRAH